jgi:hypothetical protein
MDEPLGRHIDSRQFTLAHTMVRGRCCLTASEVANMQSQLAGRQGVRARLERSERWRKQRGVDVVVEARHEDVVVRVDERRQQAAQVRHRLVEHAAVVAAVDVAACALDAHRDANHAAHAVREAREVVVNPLRVGDDDELRLREPVEVLTHDGLEAVAADLRAHTHVLFAAEAKMKS